jgi:hypothetical protein
MYEANRRSLSAWPIHSSGEPGTFLALSGLIDHFSPFLVEWLCKNLKSPVSRFQGVDLHGHHRLLSLHGLYLVSCAEGVYVGSHGQEIVEAAAMATLYEGGPSIRVIASHILPAIKQFEEELSADKRKSKGLFSPD